MTVRNDRLNDHLLRCWNDHLLRCRRRALMLIGCLYLWGLSLRLHVLTVWRWFLVECWWLMPFSKKTWSNECVWGPINGPSMTLRKSFKWMWCQDAAPDADVIRCTGGWKWCQYCCIWCWDHQMHWRSCLVVRAASDADVIRCIGSCLDVRLLHPTPKRSDERQLMLKLLHSIAMKLDALANFFWCQDCCIWCWNHQVHWRSCLIVRLLHPIVKRSDARWRLSVDAD